MTDRIGADPIDDGLGAALRDVGLLGEHFERRRVELDVEPDRLERRRRRAEPRRCGVGRHAHGRRPFPQARHRLGADLHAEGFFLRRRDHLELPLLRRVVAVGDGATEAEAGVGLLQAVVGRLERLQAAAEIVGDPTRILAGVDCGFGTFAGSQLVEASVVWAKLRALREGADLATQRLWG